MKYDPDDPRYALSPAARRRIEDAHLAGQAISTRVLAEVHTEYSVAPNLRSSFTQFTASAEPAKRIRSANLENASTVLKVVLKEFLAIGKSGQELHRIMDDEVEAAATSLGLTNPQTDVLKLELLQQERAAMREEKPSDIGFFRELASLEVQRNPVGERFDAGRIVFRPASDLFHVWKSDALFDAFIDKTTLEPLLHSESVVTLRGMEGFAIVRQSPLALGSVPGRSPETFEQWHNGLTENRTAFLEALLRAIERFRTEVDVSPGRSSKQDGPGELKAEVSDSSSKSELAQKRKTLLLDYEQRVSPGVRVVRLDICWAAGRTRYSHFKAFMRGEVSEESEVARRIYTVLEGSKHPATVTPHRPKNWR